MSLETQKVEEMVILNNTLEEMVNVIKVIEFELTRIATGIWAIESQRRLEKNLNGKSNGSY